MGIIYCLTFPNHKMYIGQTTQKLEKRISQHRKKSDCTAVYNAIQKYSNFKSEVLLITNDDMLDHYERKFIHLYNTIVPNGYNIKDGGSNGKICESTKQKMRLAQTGKQKSEETKDKISKALSNRTLSEETKKKISNTKLNTPLSEDAKQRMSRLGSKHTESAKALVSKANAGKVVSSTTKNKNSSTQRKIQDDKDLPMYVHRKEQNKSKYRSSGYIVRVPGFPSKTFSSKDMSDEVKYNLAISYLNSIKI